jgi:hypothetical protein
MSRARILVVVTGMIVAAPSGAAHAQVYYGYPQSPPYYEETWLWPGSTIEGDYARGMGAFLTGAGAYNYMTALADAIEAETLRRQIEYVEMSHRQQARIYAQRKASRHHQHERYRKETENRYRTAPTAWDVESANALNFTIREHSLRGDYDGGSGGADMPIPSGLVKQLPFRYAPSGLTFRLGDLMAGRLPSAVRAQVVRADFDRFQSFLTELDERTTTSVGKLVRFMQAFHVQLTRAQTAREIAGLTKLHEIINRPANPAESTPPMPIEIDAASQ